MFESNVNSDSIQTIGQGSENLVMFESNVNSDSIQTCLYLQGNVFCLRVM